MHLVIQSAVLIACLIFRQKSEPPATIVQPGGFTLAEKSWTLGPEELCIHTDGGATHLHHLQTGILIHREFRSPSGFLARD